MAYVTPLHHGAVTTGLGQKCLNLGLLTDLGFNIPAAFGVTFSAFELFIEPLLPEIKQLVHHLDYAKVALAIRKLILEHDTPADVHAALEDALASFPPGTYFAVRSSGMARVAGSFVTEDSSKQSLAGQYESYLRVPQRQVEHALKRCWAALYNERSLRLFKAKEDQTFFGSKMSVVIQLMIEAETSAVIMTRDPVERTDLLAMEVTFGPCEALVSGRVTGDFITVDRQDLHIVRRELGGKKHRVVYAEYSPENEGTYHLQPNPAEHSAGFAADDRLITRIANLALEIEARFGQPQDIELVVSNDELFVVQSRHITASGRKS